MVAFFHSMRDPINSVGTVLHNVGGVKVHTQWALKIMLKGNMHFV